MRKIFVSFVFIGLLTLLIAACGGGTSNGNSATGGNSDSATAANTVHLGASNFDQSSITIAKGSSLTLVDDVNVVHIINTGSWVNNVATPMQEAGAPTVNVTFNGSDTHVIGPFNTAGTYHLYCTVHPGMNLTVIVQ
jgi:plastocyanin